MNNEQKKAYNKAAGSNHKTAEGKPVLDSASATALAIVTLVALIGLVLLGAGILFVLIP